MIKTTIYLSSVCLGSALFWSELTLDAIAASISPVQSNLAADFSPAPLYDNINRLETIIPNPGGLPDATDIYYPDSAETLPAALLLQGALVDKSEYSRFSEQVASYGFAVIVPNHLRELTDPTTGDSFTGLFSEQAQVNSTLSYLKAQATDPASVLSGRIDPEKLLILGHSFGGSVGLASLGGDCVPFLCTDTYERPSQLLGGVVYGSRFSDPRLGDVIPALNNDGLPIGVIAGNRDGTTPLADVTQTYQRIEDPPKAIITLLGANHYGITNTDIQSPPPPFGSGDFRDPIRPTLDQDIATETITRWSSLFLQGTALENEQAAAYVFDFGDTLDPNVTIVSETGTAPKPIPEPSILGSLLGLGCFLAQRQLQSKSS